MIVGACATPPTAAGGVHTTSNKAPARMVPPASRFSMRRPPPTVKHAGPALRLLLEAAEVAAVVLA